MLLIRALVTLEGVGRDLDPQFNLAAELAPHVERIVRERYNPKRVTSRLLEESHTLLRLAHTMPRNLEQHWRSSARTSYRSRCITAASST